MYLSVIIDKGFMHNSVKTSKTVTMQLYFLKKNPGACFYACVSMEAFPCKWLITWGKRLEPNTRWVWESRSVSCNNRKIVYNTILLKKYYNEESLKIYISTDSSSPILKYRACYSIIFLNYVRKEIKKKCNSSEMFHIFFSKWWKLNFHHFLYI